MVLVVYGSVNGAALELAETLLDKLRRRGIADLQFMPFGAASVADLRAHSHVFVLCSTTGDGELPPNTQPLWSQLLKKSQRPIKTKFYCFGLGSTAYQKYNYAARKIFARFRQLEAVPGLAMSSIDENNADTYTHFDQWLVLALDQLDSELGLVETDGLLPAFRKLALTQEKSEVASIKRTLLTGKIVENTRLTHADHFQDVRHVVIKPDALQHYEPGDVVCLFPANSAKHVDALLDSQNWTNFANTELDIETSNYEPEGGWIRPLTLRNLVTWHLDLNCVPSAQFYNLAQHFCTNSDHQERMRELANDEDDRYAYSTRVKRTVIETVLEFDSLQIPLSYALDVFRLITPREYSIASPRNNPNIELAVAVVKYNTFLRRLRRGLCTSWLAEQTGDVYFTIKHKKLNLIEKASAEQVVLVATGTGIAPIRSLLLSTQFKNTPTLFHGTRGPKTDDIYAAELTKYARLVPAYSRSNPKQYVQDAILNTDLGLENAFIFVCGSAGKMPLAVQTALEQAMHRPDASSVLQTKQKNGMYVQETW